MTYVGFLLPLALRIFETSVPPHRSGVGIAQMWARRNSCYGRMSFGKASNRQYGSASQGHSSIPRLTTAPSRPVSSLRPPLRLVHFASRKGGSLTERAVNGMVKRTAAKAGINEAVSPHLATTRPWFACDRSRRIATGGANNSRTRQHRDHVGLPARAPGQLERLKARSRGVSSMRIRS